MFIRTLFFLTLVSITHSLAADDGVKSFLFSKSFDVMGTFSQYDFKPTGDNDPFDWAFTTSNGTSYQLQGNTPSDNDVFGWKEVTITVPEPDWYMFALGSDVDGDDSRKFDWVLVGTTNQAVYKLAGVQPNGTFAYSDKIEIDFSVNDSKIIFSEDADAEKPSKPILKTGQIISYADDDDGEYRKGVARNFTRDASKKIVTDHVNKLMWQDDAAASLVHKPWVTMANYIAGKFYDTSGDTAVTYCEELTLGGFSDWRLPEVEALSLLSEYSRYYDQDDSAMDATFDNVIPYYYWSVTSVVVPELISYAWTVGFFYGDTNVGSKLDVSHYVRCVRDVH